MSETHTKPIDMEPYYEQRFKILRQILASILCDKPHLTISFSRERLLSYARPNYDIQIKEDGPLITISLVDKQ